MPDNYWTEFGNSSHSEQKHNFQNFAWRGQDWIEIELESGDMSTLDFFALFPSYLLPLDFPGVVIFLNIDLIEGL